MQYKMGLGNGNSKSRDMGSNFNYQFRSLQVLGEILNSLASSGGSSGSSSGGATETTLSQVLTTLNNLYSEQRLDFETRSVKDSSGNIYLMRISWDDSADSYTIDYIDGSGSVVTPTAPIQIYNTDGILTSILTELQKLTIPETVSFTEDSTPSNAGTIAGGTYKKVSIQFYGKGGLFEGVAVEDCKVISIKSKGLITNSLSYTVPNTASAIDGTTRVTILTNI